MGAGAVSLAARVRRKFHAGELPHKAPSKVSGRYGRGEPCLACDDPLLPAQVVYQFELEGTPYGLHIGCYGVWLGELIRRGLY
jgi:hypothetical protein